MGTAGTGLTWTIDTNANVQYPLGADITFVNEGSGSAGTLSIVTSDTLVLFPSGETGTRSLVPYEIATALKIGTTKWLIAGCGIISSTSGSSGVSGSSGTSGTSGSTGTHGTSGSSGTSGGVGTSGTSGGTGTSGTSGTSATSGTSGSSATSGTSGTIGTVVLGTPQNIQISNYTTVLIDQGKHIFYPGTCGTSGTGRIWTIDSNANVPYPIGADITFVNQGSGSAGTISILVTDDILTLFPSGPAGTRALAPYGIATALKIGETNWLIAGVGIT
jgi:hypothetical protein